MRAYIHSRVSSHNSLITVHRVVGGDDGGGGDGGRLAVTGRLWRGGAVWTSAVGLRWSVVVLRGRTHSRPRTYRKCRIVRALKRKFHIRENHKCIVHQEITLNRQKRMLVLRHANLPRAAPKVAQPEVCQDKRSILRLL